MNIEVTRGNEENYSEIVKILTGEGLFNIFKWSDPPGSRYPWHTHPHDEVRWVLEGSILIGIQNGEVILRAGDRLDVKANTKHWAKTDEGVSYVCGSKQVAG